MQLNIQSSFGRARGLLRRLICRGLPERSLPISVDTVTSPFTGVCRHAPSIDYPFNNAQRQPQVGFTLVELLVVITLLGVLAIGIVVSLDGVEDDANVRLTKAEMSELRKALLQFKRDVGHFPGFSSPFPPAENEVLNLLKDCQADDAPEDAADPNRLTYDTGCREYNIDTGRGWNGPYALPERINNSVTPGYYDGWGNPYYLIEPDDATPGQGVARIISYGPNRSYEGENVTDVCAPFDANSDDIVLCLVQ